LKKFLYIAEVLRKRGLGFFWAYFSQSVWFDLRHGTKTFARVPKDEQTIESSGSEADNGLLYVASFTSVTRDAVRLARNILTSERFARAQFVDLGCGKGKALLVFAQQFGTQQALPAIGIEYDPQLADLAKRNIEKCDFAVGRVEVITDSAVNVRDYTKSDTLIIYLYNSFQGKTLRSVLSALGDVPHVLIYVDPAEKTILTDYGYTVHSDNHGRYNADTWLIASVGLT